MRSQEKWEFYVPVEGSELSYLEGQDDLAGISTAPKRHILTADILVINS